MTTITAILKLSLFLRVSVNLCVNLLFLPFSPSFLQGGAEERLCPVIMCTRAFPDPVPECQLFPGEVEEPEEAEEGRERESDRDSAVESTLGSDTSDGPIRPGDKGDILGELFLSGVK